MSEQIQGFRLSPHQKRLLTLPGGGEAHLAQCAILVEGDGRADLLRAAVGRVAERHEILRTNFRRLPGVRLPIQVVAERREPAWRDVDLTGADGRAEAEKVEALLADDAARPFDLEGGSPVRCTLASLSAGRRLLLITLPSLCADSRALHNIFKELGAAYAARPGAESDEAAQYVQFSEWQNELLEEGDAEGCKQLWRDLRASAQPAPALPLERKAAGTREGARAFFTLAVDAGLTAKLAAEAARHETPFESFLFACWQLFHWRLTGQPEVTTGITLDGRKYEELEDALGLFAKCLPVTTRFADGMRLGELLSGVRRSVSDALTWHEYYLWEEGAAAADPAPGLPFLFEFEQRPPGYHAGGLSFSVHAQRCSIEDAGLKLTCVLRGQALDANFRYDPDRFDPSYVELLAGQFHQLLKSIALHPEAAAGEFVLVGEEERRRILFDFNETGAAYPSDKCVHELFEEQAARTPDNVAVVCGDGQLTYAELNARANRLAHYLKGHGVAADDRVGICTERGAEMLVGLLGVLKAGAAYVPLDPSYPRERLSFMLSDAGVSLLLTKQHLAAAMPETSARLFCLDTSAPSLSSFPAENPAPSAAADNLAYVIYTSGSTGTPKGAMISHGGVINYLHWCAEAYGAAAGSGAPVHSPLGFDLTVTSLFSPLTTGAAVVLLPEEDGAQALAAALNEARDYSLVKLTPAHLELLAQTVDKEAAPRSTRALVIGGEALHAEALQFWREHAPGVRLVNEYGPTETVVGCCVHEVKPGDDLAGPIPIGRPIANTRLYVLDPRGEVVPVGISGELHIGGAGLARGYLNRPGLTAERFIPDGFGGEAGGRLYRTGDLARYRADGTIDYLGRIDHQVKVRGFRIELGEIEAALRGHERVTDVAVIAREDESRQKRLVAYVVPPHGGAPTDRDLRDYLRERLPEYMVPSFFVTLTELPLNANGKIDRKALPAPEQARPEVDAYAPPRTPTEQLLCAIWQQVLGVERVGIRDNFFELGGDSILSIQIIARANQSGLRLMPKQLFEHRTVEQLAQAAEAAATPSTSAEQGAVTGEVPLTPIQHWYFEQEPEDISHFNQSVMLRPHAPVDIEALRRVVARLMGHHDALRLRFTRTPEGWRQHVSAPIDEQVVEVIDLRGVGASARAAAVTEAAGRVQRSLDIERGPLMRVALIRLCDETGGEEQRLLLAVHHLAVDGVSWRVLLEDLQRGYEQARRGMPVEFGEKTTSFKAWAECLRQYASSPGLGQQRAYWEERAGARVAPMPVDFRGGENLIGSVETVGLSLDEVLTRRLLLDAGRAYNTRITELLLAALARAWRRWSNQGSLRVDLEGHGREQEEVGGSDVTRTVGWFTTIYPVVVSGRGGVGECVKAAKEELRGVPGGGLGYGVLKYLGGDTGAGWSDGEVIFNYLGQLDQVLDEGGGFSPAEEDAGEMWSPAMKRRHLLEVSGSVVGGRLQMGWSYSRGVHRRGSIEALVGEYEKALEEIIEHCTDEGAGGYTPSDFPDVFLNQEQLNMILEKVS